MLPFDKPSVREGRVSLSPKQRKALLDRFCAKQAMLCVTCNCRMTREVGVMNTATLGHRNPQPAGCKKDDRPENLLGAQCWSCNTKRGSKRDEIS